MVEEQTSRICRLITDYEEVLSKLGQYRRQLKDWKTQHYQVQDRLVEQNNAAIELQEQDESSVEYYITQGEEGKEKLQEILLCLNATEINSDDMDMASDAVENWFQMFQACQQLFPNYNTIQTSEKVCC